MSKKVLILSLLGYFLLINTSVAKDVVILGPQSQEDISHHYFTSLIELAISKTSAQSNYKRVRILNSQQTTQGRSLNLLQRDLINIFWSGTSIKREELYIPIKIPLFKGLLGYRMMIVRNDNVDDFQQISEQALKQKIACQGQHWPDSDILEANGYRVLRVARFDLMFKMLKLKRCDYFPRAIFEGYGEYTQAIKKYPNLAIYDETLLHYPFPIYFFTNKNHPELAKQVTQGLMIAAEDGSLNMLIDDYASSLNIFPLDKWESKRYFHLSNDFLPDISSFESSNLWLKLFDNTNNNIF